VRLGNGPADIDPATRVRDHDRVETLMAGILARITNAEIEGEPRQEHAREGALAQISGKPGASLAVVLVERRLGIDLAVIALAQHEFGVRNLQVLSEFGSRRPLNTVVGPKLLGPIGDLDDVVRFPAMMRGREREMSTRVPVLGEYHVLEPRGEAVDQRHHVFAVRNRKASAEAEVILNVHHQQDIPVADLYLLIHQRDPSCIASR
jgi:hypothetical protein